MATPFTVEHFEAWCSGLTLDNDESFRLEGFQRAFVADLFTGRPVNWFIVPEASGKTTLMAALAIYWATFKPLSRVAVAASSREQAELLFDQASGFILRSELAGIAIQEGYRRLKFENGSRVKVYSASDKTGDGLIPDFAIIDELHRHQNLNLYLVWQGKLKKRNGQLVVISTAGEPYSDFETTREAMRQQGIAESSDVFVRCVTDQYVLHDWGLHEGDPEDLELVARANPFSGTTVEELRAKRKLPGMTLQHWLRFTCNRPARSSAAAITEQEWYAAKATEALPAGVEVWAGLDVGWRHDTTALVALWIDDATYHLGEASIVVPPRDGNSLDPSKIKEAILSVHERNPIHTLVMDTFGAEDIAAWIEDELGIRVVERNQSIPNKAEEYAAFTKLLRNDRLRHRGDVGLTRHVLNANAYVLPGGDTRFVRPVRSRNNAAEQDNRVIDALDAAAMVLAVASNNLEPPTDGALFAVM